MKISWYRRLTTQISLFVLASTLLTALAVAAIALRTGYEFVLEKVERELPLRVHAAAANVDRWYAQQAREITVFANSEVLRKGVMDNYRGTAEGVLDLRQFLAQVLDNSPNYRAMLVLDDEQHPIVQVGENLQVPGTVEVPPLAAPAPAVSEVMQFNGAPAQVLSLAIPMGTGQRTATFWAVNQLDILDRILDSEKQESTVTLTVLDSDMGVVLDTQNRWGRVDPGRDWRSGADRELLYYKGADGSALVGAMARLPSLGGMLVAEQLHSEFYLPLVQKMAGTIGAIAVIVLILCLAAYRVARSIVKPIRALTDGAQKMRSGEVDFRVDTGNTNNEIGMLAEAFNSMAMGLKQQSLEIAHINDRLVAKNDELNRLNDQLYQQSVTDELTQIHNQRFFREHLKLQASYADRKQIPLCLILFDVDYFKQWNDRYGHPVGDQILQALAQLLRDKTRASDVVARYAGDEFVVLTPDTDLDGAKQLAAKIQNAVRYGLTVPEGVESDQTLSLSIGIADYRGDAGRLFADADRALYRSKERGRDAITTVMDVLSDNGSSPDGPTRRPLSAVK